MLGHRLRRWPNIETTLAERHVFARMPYTQIFQRFKNKKNLAIVSHVRWDKPTSNTLAS